MTDAAFASSSSNRRSVKGRSRTPRNRHWLIYGWTPSSPRSTRAPLSPSPSPSQDEEEDELMDATVAEKYNDILDAIKDAGNNMDL